jgi:hypothetical protein
VDQAKPALIRDELVGHIQHAISSHPRSQQAELGPSEVGKECTRWLAYRLLEVPEANPRQPSWRPTVGTAVHAWLAEVFQDVDGAWPEHDLSVGLLEGRNGYAIGGHSDLFYRGFVIDWKIVGGTTMKKAARGEISDQYRNQAHLYGKGYEDQGFEVEQVAIFFLPAAGEFRDAVFWSEPYNRQVAVEALTRLNAVKTLVDSTGSSVLSVLSTADDYCQKCEFFKPQSEDLAEGCPGHNPAPPKSVNESFMD